MMQRKTGAIARLKTTASAHAAAMMHRHPSRKMHVVLVIGQDGAVGTIACLASILRTAGERVGVITHQYIEIVDGHVDGSSKGDAHSNPFRLQSLLAQMRRAKCTYVLIEVPAELPVHQFAGVQPTMLIVRRCGDDYTDSITTTARIAMLDSVLARKPQFVVINKDDPSAQALAKLSAQEGAITFGAHHKADAIISNVQLHPKGSAVDVVIDHQTTVQLATELAGKQAIYNAVAAATAAYALRAPIAAIEDGVRVQPALRGACQFIPIQRPYKIAVDDVNTPGGLAETLEALQHFAKNRLIVVLSVPLETQESWCSVMGEITARFADRIIVCDGEYAATQSPQVVREQLMAGILLAGGEGKTQEIVDRKEAIDKAIGIARRGDIIVVACSTQRPYRQLGQRRSPWDDGKVIAELFDL